MKLDKVAKAITGAAAAGVGALIVATADGSGISVNEWLASAGAVLASLALVWAVPNGPTELR
jgi:hypothetical protein